MTTTTIAEPPQSLGSNNPFRQHALAGGRNDSIDVTVSDLVNEQAATTDEEAENDPQLDQEHPTRPGMPDRNRSLSATSSSSKQFRLHRKPPPPPPRPIFPPPQNNNDTNLYAPPERPRRETLREKGRETSISDLERQEKILLQRAIEESKRESTRRDTSKSDEDEQLRRALEASRQDPEPVRASLMSFQESAELERALALSTAEHESRLPRSSNTPSPTKPRTQESTPTRLGRSISESRPEDPPPFPFTAEDLVRPSYPKEKSHLFPQGLPSLPPGAGSTSDEYEREMEMLTLAIRMSEEEERLRREREERELNEVVRRVEEKENAALGASTKPPVPARRTSPPSSAESSAAESASPTTSPRTKRSSWFRPPLASKFSTTASPPASPPLSPESITRPGLEATPTDSTFRSNATSFQSAAESLPFTNLISTNAVPNDLSSRIEAQKPQRKPPAPPHPTRLPPSPPETPIVSTTSFAPAIPPLPAPYARSRQNTAESYRSAPFLPAHSEAFRHENDGSPVEMPYLTPSASNSIRSMHKGGGGDNAGRLNSLALEERNGSGGSGSGGSRSESTGEHSRVNSTNRRSGTSSQNRSEEGHGGEGSTGRRSFEEGEDFHDENPRFSGEEVRLAIRNPDSASPALPVELQHQDGFVSEPPAVDVPRDIEVGDPYLENLEGPIFESAYAGRSMSAIDEQTEPASSIIAEDGFSRQGSYPSNEGSLDPTIHRGETERVLEGLSTYGGGGGGEEMRQSITYHPRPIDEREWMHESALRRPSQPPLTDSLTPTPPRRHTPPSDPDPPHARQVTASSAITESSAGPRLSFPLPPFNSTLPPMSASPVESSLTPTTTAPTARFDSSEEPISTSEDPQSSTPTSLADGTRFGHPSICAREPGHVCPHDGLERSSGVPESIELTALMEDERESSSAIGLGLHRHSTRRREETGGKSILRDAWAVEARNLPSLLRFLMWYGDTTIVASRRDVALEPTRHCTAAASLEFRPDDEGFTIIRLVVAILPPSDPEAHSHRELTVEHPATTPPTYHGKGKGKARSYFHSSSSAAPAQDSFPSSLATFHLPDSVHLPCRLSNLAIQLYTLRHLASIARSTQPAKEGGTASYQALRALSIALENLTSVSQSRLERDASSHQGPSHYRAQSGGGGGEGNRSDEDERLLTRLRDRLRRLKRGGGNENAAPNTSPTKPNKLVKAPPIRRDTSQMNNRDTFAALTQTVQPLSRTERVLSANDHEHDEEEELGENDAEERGSGNGGGSGNHFEVDQTRFSIVRREPAARRERLPEEWDRRRNPDVSNETSYMPILRS